MKPLIKEVIVVEGKRDSQRLFDCVQCLTIETNGSALHDDVIREIGVALELHGVIVFTDPDYPGKQIRHKIRNIYPTVKEAFLKREVAQGKRGKIGIEHATCEEIIRALEVVMTNDVNQPDIYSVRDMMRYGLSGQRESKILRMRVCDALNIEYSNAGQLLNKLNRYQISRVRLEGILSERK